MLHVTKMADYAVVILCEFAAAGAPVKMSARDVSAATGIGEPSVMKLLKLLTKAGITSSVRGAAGGYSIAKDASAVSLYDVIAAIEGKPCVTDCSGDAGADGKRGCDLEQQCGAKYGWSGVNDRINAYLASVSIADFASAKHKRAQGAA